MEEKWYESYQKVVYRHLKCKRDPEFLEKLNDFATVLSFLFIKQNPYTRNIENIGERILFQHMGLVGFKNLRFCFPWQPSKE